MKRFLSTVLSIAILVSTIMVVPVSAAEKKPATDFSKFTDVQKHWAKDHLKWAVQNNIMYGVTKTKMNPNANITRAQMATMITRAFGATNEADVSMFIDVPENAWFKSAIAKAVQMGFLETFGNSVNPNAAVTREEVAVSLVKAAGYGITNDSAWVNQFTDVNKINPNYIPYMSTALRNGIISGYGDGRLGPKDKITRAQFAAILRRVASAYMNQITSYGSKNVEGSLMVGVGDIKLAGMNVTENVFLSDGVGTGEITFDNSTVGGVVYVRGTGPNTVKMSNRSTARGMIFCNPNNAVHLVVDEDSSVGWIQVDNAVDSVTLEGNIRGDVIVNTGKAPVTVIGADIDSLELGNRLATVKVDKTSSIENLRLSKNAIGAVAEVECGVRRVYIDAPDADVTLNGSVERLEFGTNARSTKFTVGKEVDMDLVTLNAPKLDLNLNGKMTDIDIGSDDSKMVFGKDTESKRIDIDGNDVDFEFNGTVKSIHTTGDDLVIGGKGKVTDMIVIDDGDDITITIPGAKVFNKGGKNVYVGNVLVRKGETVTVNASGTGTVEDDIENGRDPNAGAPGDPNNPQAGKIYTLTFVPNGGSCSVKTLRTDASGVVPALPTPTWAGHEFLGWYTAAVGGDKIVQGVAIDRHRTLYAQWKESEKPGGGTGGEGEGGQGGTGGDQEQGGTAPTLFLDLPREAAPSDFGFEGAYAYSSFGAGIELNTVTYELSGTISYIENFKWFEGDTENATGFYVPILLTSSISSPSGVVMAGGKRFTTSQITSNGIKYGGQMIAYVPLAPNKPVGEKKVELSYDPDGSGKEYSKKSITIDYSKCIFSGGNVADTFYDGVTALPGIDGAETATFDVTMPEKLNYRYTMHTKALLETSNNGRYGYWTGLRIPAFQEVKFAKVRQVSPTGEQSTYTMPVTAGDSGSKYIDWIINASTKSLGDAEFKGVYRIEITWMLDNEILSSYPTVKMMIDLKDCKLAGEATDPSIKPDAKPIATDLKIELMTEEETRTKFQVEMADLGVDLRVSQDTLGGTLLKYKNVDKQLDGYYVPLKITGKAAADLTLKRDKGASVANAITDADEFGNFTAYALFEMLSYGNGVSDTRIEVEPVKPDPKYKSTHIVLRCDAAMVLENGLLASSEVPSGEVAGVQVTDMIKDPTYRVFYNTLEAGGTVKKLSSITVNEKEHKNVWVVPVKMRVNTDLAEYSIKSTSAAIAEFHTLTQDDVKDKYVTVLVPVAIDGKKASVGYVEFSSGKDSIPSVLTVYLTDLVLEGYIDKPTEKFKTLTGIELNTDSAKKEYKVGETFVKDGIRVTGVYKTDEGPLKEEVTGWTTDYDDKSFDSPGSVTVTATYTEEKVTQTATFEVNVSPAEDAGP